MAISDDFGYVHAEIADLFGSATVTYTYDSGTVASLTATYEDVSERTENGDAKGSPNVGALRKYWIRSSGLTIARHMGSDTITHGSDVWRTLECFPEAGAGNLVFLCELDKSFSEA